jgi:hypothetical protein
LDLDDRHLGRETFQHHLVDNQTPTRTFQLELVLDLGGDS